MDQAKLLPDLPLVVGGKAEAARAVGGLLAKPVFPESRGPKDTDFNDLARLAGTAAGAAKIVFIVGIILFLVSLFMGRRRP